MEGADRLMLAALGLERIDRMESVRRFLRNFTASAVKEHLRSAIEVTGGSPDLTANEVELVRFVCEGSFDWNAFLADRRPS